jgi:hypothetical protein
MAEETNYLEEGFELCRFGGKEKDQPTGLNSRLAIEKYVAALILVDNDNLETGEKIVKWKSGEPIPEDVIGVVLNKKALLREKVTLTDSNEGAVTPEEWEALHKTDGLALWALNKMSYLQTGGGVKTPGQQVTAPGQVGHAKAPTMPVKKLGLQAGK